MLGLLEDKAVRRRPSWTGVKVRSGPYAVPLMVVPEADSSGQVWIDDERVFVEWR